MNRNSPRHPFRGNSKQPGPESLGELMAEAGVRLDAGQVRSLWTFHTLLRKRNAELNMTRIHNFEMMVIKHYVDSIVVSGLFDLPSPLLDIGSGAGFPGIPLKIACPEKKLVLAEGRARRADFLKEAVDLLGLEGVEVFSGKVTQRFDIPVRGVITRALEDIPGTLQRVFPFLPGGAPVLFMKGPGCDKEIEEAAEKAGAAFRLALDKGYELPLIGDGRRLVVFERRIEEVSHPAFAGPVREIESPSNREYRKLAALLTGQGIRKHGMALFSGARPIGELLGSYRDSCKGWITQRRGGPPPPQEAADLLTWYRLSAPLFRELDVSGTGNPLLLAERPPLPTWKGGPLPEGCTLLIPFQDPENVGAVIRSAAAFGVAQIVLLAEAANPFLPKSQRAAGSTLFRVPLFKGPSLKEIDAADLPLVTLSARGRSVAAFDFPRRFALLAGMEGPGLPDRLRKGKALAIEMEEGVESLNAATSVAVALYAWRRGR